MANLWLPSGNKKQIEIDVEIAALDSHRARAAIDLVLTRKNLIEIEEDLYELSDCLSQLKSGVLIVSLREYHLVKVSYNNLINVKTQYINMLNGLKKSIKVIDDKKEELLKLRDKCATKILEFNYNERIKKRYKDRD